MSCELLGMPRAKQTDLEDMIGPSYRIPDYQRSYSWEDREVKDLLNDVNSVVENDYKTYHYLNNIVVYKGDNHKMVVDGQQRLTTLMLFMSSVRREIRRIIKTSNSNVVKKHLAKEDAEAHKYIKQVKYVFLPQENHQETYKRLVDKIDEDELEDYHWRQYGDMEYNDIYEKRLVNAKKTIDRWIDSKKAELEESPRRDAYAHWIDDIKDVLENKCTFTEFEVDSRLEAAEMFGIINDRGRDLNVGDQVKSYAVYRLSQIEQTRDISNEDTVDTIDMNEVFNTIVEEVAQLEGGDYEINEFMKEHWRLFSGDIRPDSEVHRELKSEENIPADISEDRLLTWMDAYHTSLEAYAGLYKYFNSPEEVSSEIDLLPKNSDRDKIAKRLYAISKFGPTQAILSYGMSLLSVYDDNNTTAKEKQLVTEAIDALESLVVWGYEVEGKRNDFCRSDIRKSAHEIEWNLRDRDPSDVFGGDYDGLKTDSLEEALTESIDSIYEKLGPLPSISDTLRHDNIYDGDNVSGWTGVNKPVIRYILSEYENYKSQYNEITLSKLKPSVKKNDPSIEHIFPQTPNRDKYDYDISETNEEEYINRLGNLAVLPGDKNSSWGNHPYLKKKKQYNYTDSFTTIREIFESRHSWSTVPNGMNVDHSKWTETDIERRTDAIAEFAEDRWGN